MKNIYIYVFLLLVILFLSIICINKKESFSEGVVGTNFVSRVPQGVITAYYPKGGNLTNIPSGWALCDGSNGTPDLRGKFILGYQNVGNGSVNAGNGCPIFGQASWGNCNQFGLSGGEYSHTLTIPEIPSHLHSVQWGNFGTNWGHGGGNWTVPSGQAGAGNTDNTGGGGAHNIMPPYVVLVYIMKL